MGLFAFTLIMTLIVGTLVTVGGLGAPQAQAAPAGHIPAPDGTPWLDSDGDGIAAHGGSVVQVSEAEVGLDITGDGAMSEDVWLWYGEDKTNATRPVDGVRGYWSTDLTVWHDMGQVLPSHQQFALKVSDDGTQVQVDQAKVDEIKATANKTAPDTESTQEQIDDARAFVDPYVETWADEAAGIAATYDDAALSHAAYRLNGNINIMERPKMLWNAKTQKFVIIYHADGPLATSSDLIRWVSEGGDPSDRNIGSRYSLAEIGFATSDTPWGPFKLVNTTKMNYAEGVPPAGREGDARDMTIFQDEGSHTVDPTSDDAYAVYSSEMNKWMYVSRLNADYTGPLEDGTDAVLGDDFSNRVLPDFSREASSVFKYDDWYYMITSGTDGWASTPVVAYRSRSMITPTEAVVGNNNGHPTDGQWERLDPANPCIGDASRTGVGTASPVHCFDSQPTFVITLDAEAGQYIYMGDRWAVDSSTGSAGQGSRYVWAPIQVDSESGSIRIENVGDWDPTDATLFETLPDLELTAHVDDRDTFAPVFSMVVGGETYPDLTATWNEAELDAAFSGAGSHHLTGHIDDGPLSGRAVQATLDVDGPLNVCTQPGTTVSASFHQTQYDTFPAANACDGNLATPWSTWASAADRPDQVTFTAGFTRAWNIERVAFTNNEGAIAGGTIEYRDPVDGQWHDASPAGFDAVVTGENHQLDIDPVQAIGIRVTFDTNGSYLKIGEIAMLGTEVPPVDPVNVCVDPGTTVSASFHQTQYDTLPATRACDGDAATLWSTWASAGTRPDQVTFTAQFDALWEVDSLSFTNTEGQIDGVGLEYFDPSDETWTATDPASTGAVTNGTPQVVEFAPEVASAVRLTFDVNGSWLKIPEIEIMGIPATGDVPDVDDPSIEWSEIVVDGNDVERDDLGTAFNTFGGFGAVSANNTSNLLLDYKEEHPEVYWAIMESLFDPDTGAGLNHIKLELGGDVDTSSGTEPATKRSESEPADVLRGAGFHFAADALSINPDIKTEALRWAEPSWTNGDYEKRYAWHLETMEAAYDVFGIEFDYLSPSQNEVSNSYMNAELDWTVWFAKRIAAEADEPDARYDYSEIKIVALDSYRNGENVATRVINHPDAVDWIDAIGYHYTLEGGANLTRLNKEFGMEILYSEGIAPMIEPKYRILGDPARGGVGGTTSAADIADRFIGAYRWAGAGSNPAHMTAFLFQPASSAMYEGVRYTPKSLVQASDPWSGYHEGGLGINTVRHFHQFIDRDWEYIEGASMANGSLGDGGTNVDTGSRSYLTLRTPAGATGEPEFTQVHANNTSTLRHFEVKVANLSDEADRPLHLWETIGPETAGDQVDSRHFQPTGSVAPVRTESIGGVDHEVYRVSVQPYSILTVSTLANGLGGTTDAYVPGEYDSPMSHDTMELPYADDFEYSEYPTATIGGEEMTYVERRSGNPRYFADQEGAFEVVEDADAERGNVLQQKIHAQNRPFTWNVWGSGDPTVMSTASPYTIVGDHAWANYTASVDVKFDTLTRNASFANYASVGVRQHRAPDHANGFYSLRLYVDGDWELRRLNTVVDSGSLFMMDATEWHNLSLSARDNTMVVSIDGEELAVYADNTGVPMLSGRVSFGSGFYQTQFDNLEITPVDGMAWESVKHDDATAIFDYDGATFSQVGFADLNRTMHRLGAGASMSLEFEGSGLTLFGGSGAATIAVSVDGGPETTTSIPSSGSRQATYWLRGLEEPGAHTLDVRVVSGTYSVDGVDILTGGDSATVPPELTPVSVDESIDRLAVFVGETPTLPATLAATSATGASIDAAVDWTIPASGFDTPYRMTAVTGTFEANPGLSVTAYVEVVPRDARYFIDIGGAGSGSPAAVAYPAVAALADDAGNALLNGTPDGAYSVGTGWGAAATYTYKGWVSDQPYNKFSTTGTFTAGIGTALSYRVTLPAGDYVIASGHHEWWSAGSGTSRNGIATVNFADAGGAAVSIAAGTYAFPASSVGAQATLGAQFSLEQETVVTYTIANNGGTEAPVMSWLGVHVDDEDAVPVDRSELAALLAEAGATSVTDYTPESWFALRLVALAALDVHDDPSATQLEVDAAAGELEAALAALVEIPTVALSDYRIATPVGVVPALPEMIELATSSGDVSEVAVEWESLPASAVQTPYDTATVTGQAGATVVTMNIEVVPASLLYFVDAAAFVSGSTSLTVDSPAHRAMADLLGEALLNNDAPDQPYSEPDGWGLLQPIGSGTSYVGAKAAVAGPYDKTATTGWWLGGTGGDSIDYAFDLEPGTYDVSLGYREWWSQNRFIQPSVTVDGATVNGAVVALSGAAAKTETIQIVVEEAGEVTVSSARASGTQLPVLSWIGIAQVHAELESLRIDAEPTRTEYEQGDMLDLDGLAVTAVYADASTSAVPVGSLTVSGFDSSVSGTQAVTLEYTDASVTVSTSFEVTVVEPAVPVVEMVDEATGVRVVGTAATIPAGAEIIVTLVESGPEYDALRGSMPDTGAVLYDIVMVVEGESVQPLGAVTVYLPIPADADPDTLVAVYIDDDLVISTMPSDQPGGELRFETSHFSVYGAVWLLDASGDDAGGGGGGGGDSDGALSNSGVGFPVFLSVLLALALVMLGGALIVRRHARVTALF
jgi:hypothetical protein